MAKFRAIHTIELKKDVDPEEFEDFMLNEFLAEKLSLEGCLEAQLLKGYKEGLPGVAQSKVDYAWITLWEDIETNSKVWSQEGKHYIPDNMMKVSAKLYHYAANYSLVGGFVVVESTTPSES